MKKKRLFIYITLSLILGVLIGIVINGLFNYFFQKKWIFLGGNLVILFILCFIGVLISGLMFFILNIGIKNYFKRDYKIRKKIKGREELQSEFLFNDKELLESKPKWNTKRYDIYDIKQNQPKLVLDLLNKKVHSENVEQKEAGFVIRSIFNNKSKSLQNHTVSNLCARIIGDSGSGKTVSIIIPTIIHNAFLPKKEQPTLIINDPKGEIYEKTANSLKKNGYEIITFNLRDTNQSSAWNPLTSIYQNWLKSQKTEDEFENITCALKTAILSHCRNILCYTHTVDQCYECINLLEEEFDELNGVGFKINFINKFDEKKQINYKYYFSKSEDKEIYKEQLSKNFKTKAFAEIAELSAILWPQKNNDTSNSNFFTGSSARFFQGVLMFLLSISNYNSKMVNENNFNLKAVTRIINDKTKLFQFIKEEVNKRDCSLEDWYSKLWDTVVTYENNPRNVDNWYSTVTEKLTVFDNIELDNIICKNDIDVNKIIKKPTAIFIIVSDTKDSAESLTSLFIGQIYNQLIEKASLEINQRLKRKVLFILDEFGNMFKIKPFIKAFSIARSRNIDILICYQNFEQIESKYGKNDAASIIKNIQLTYFISSQAEEDYEYISKSLGTVDEINYSINDKNQTNASLNENARLFSKEQLKRLPHPLVVVMLDKTNFISYFLPSWIGETYLKDFNNKPIYNLQPIEEDMKFNKSIIFEKGYKINLENEYIEITNDIVLENEYQDYQKDKNEYIKNEAYSKNIRSRYHELIIKKELSFEDKLELKNLEKKLRELNKIEIFSSLFDKNELERH